MRLPATALLATLLAGCAAEAPPALEIDSVDDQQAHALGWVVPDGSASAHAARPVAPTEPEAAPQLEPSPLPGSRPARPRLAFVWEWGEYAHADSCNFGVNFLGGPAVSDDGRYVIHDHRDDDWESDGGEGWQDYYDQEPVIEGMLTLVDLQTGTSTTLGSLLEEPPPHRNSGELHCRQLRPLLEAGVKRINAKLPKTTWRHMTSADDLGIRVLNEESLQVLADEDADRRPVEFILRNDTFTLRRKGITVLHREELGPLSTCNMELTVGNVLIDVPTGYTLATVLERCVCFGSESDRVFAFTLSETARSRVAELAPVGRAVLEDS